MSGKQNKAAQIHSRPAGSSSFREELGAAPPLITLRAVILGVLTIGATFTYIIQIGQRLRIASFVHSQFPMAAFTPFVLWLFLKVGNRCCSSRKAGYMAENRKGCGSLEV